MACAHTPTCPLFKLFISKAILRFWVKVYCEGECSWERCVRFQRTEHGEVIPDNLLPNGDSLKVNQ